MDNTAELEYTVVAMLKSRKEVQLVLGDDYSERVSVYIKIVKYQMTAKNINAVVAAIVILEAAGGQINPTTSALIVAAAIEIIIKDDIAPPHLTSMFYKGGLAPAVLVDGRERREGVDHG